MKIYSSKGLDRSTSHLVHVCRCPPFVFIYFSQSVGRQCRLRWQPVWHQFGRSSGYERRKYSKLKCHKGINRDRMWLQNCHSKVGRYNANRSKRGLSNGNVRQDRLKTAAGKHSLSTLPPGQTDRIWRVMSTARIGKLKYMAFVFLCLSLCECLDRIETNMKRRSCKFQIRFVTKLQYIFLQPHVRKSNFIS